MDLFVKTCGGALLAVILILSMGNRSKELSLVLAIGACCMIALAALSYLEPVIKFVTQLENLGGLDHSLIRILLKVVGIGLLTEIAGLVCTDGGSASLGKTIKLMGSAVMIWLSLPLYTKLMELLQRILCGL